MKPDIDLLLGRALIAAAWSDGQLDASEREALEDLLLGLDGITPDTWRALHTDLERPFDPEHRERLFVELEAALTDQDSRERSGRQIARLIHRLPAESEESRALGQLAELLARPSSDTTPATGMFSRLGGALTNGLGRHAARLKSRREEERRWENSLRSRLAVHWPASEDWPEDDELHRLCTGAAILAHVVRLDGAVNPGEREALDRALINQWGLSAGSARLATELVLDETAGGIDLHLLLREFQRVTTEDERTRFLAAVFTVAASDGRASYDEIEEVRRIGRGLLLSHQHFITAKLSVPGEKRET
jgi:uncharacterized tellurite resistance protein B-like protein